ncbi:1-acyl-sn-glycerol-3-phosphate acyltransferase [bacterium]|nr:1-acyl-sn-glycerol-3-phosphate acyltransferase [bacterium]
MQSIQQPPTSLQAGAEYSDLLGQPSRVGNACKTIFQWYCKGLFTFYCPLQVTGKENLPQGSFIFCSNHNSHMDSAILMTSSGMPFKKFGMVAASDYFFENGLRRRFLGALMNLIPIDREPKYHSIVELVIKCKKFINSDSRNIIIFPEGTRSLTGQIQAFKKGPAFIAIELALPIVPVYIYGTYQAMPKGHSLMKPGRIRAWIGKPLYPAYTRLEDTNGRLKGGYRALTRKLETRIQELMEACHAAG